MIENLSVREKEILSQLSDNSSLTVSDISKLLNVSTVTIRSDLTSLEGKGFIVRTRGGAFLSFHPSIAERQRLMIEEKSRIAKKAAALVRDGASIMIEAGTTTALITKFLLGKRDIHVVTNSTLLIPYARFNPGINLTVVGGSFRSSTESLVGPAALRELEQFHVQYAFVGTDGFSLEKGLTTHLPEGAEIVKKMAEQAETTILVADSSKYDKLGFVRVLPLARLGMIITDSGLSKSISRLLEEIGPTVISA